MALFGSDLRAIWVRFGFDLGLIWADLGPIPQDMVAGGARLRFFRGVRHRSRRGRRAGWKGSSATVVVVVVAAVSPVVCICRVLALGTGFDGRLR